MGVETRLFLFTLTGKIGIGSTGPVLGSQFGLGFVDYGKCQVRAAFPVILPTWRA
jgi:hypothetical protein